MLRVPPKHRTVSNLIPIFDRGAISGCEQRTQSRDEKVPALHQGEPRTTSPQHQRQPPIAVRVRERRCSGLLRPFSHL